MHLAVSVYTYTCLVYPDLESASQNADVGTS